MWPIFPSPNAPARAAAWTLGVFALGILGDLPAHSKPREQTVPTLNEVNRVLVGRVERVDAPPSLGRSQPTQILMRPQLVAPAAEIAQESVEHGAVGEDELPQTSFQRPEEAFDASVLPRAVQIDALVANPQQLEADAEHLSGEAALIVRAHELGLAELGDRKAQVSQQRPADLRLRRTSRSARRLP